MSQLFTIRVNGTTHEIDCDPETPLLYVLRNHLQLNGPKFGCGLAQCGSCLVLLDDRATYACRYQVQDVGRASVTTLEGLSRDDGEWHPVQQSFFDEQAAQCGYCTNGLVIRSVALLRENPHPTTAEIKQALNPHICRCGIHSRAIRAVKKVADS